MAVRKSVSGIRKHIEGALIDLGLYETADDHLIELTALSLKLAYDSYKDMAENGYAQTFKTGVRQVSPEYTVWSKSIEEYRRLARELGLSPKARQELQSQMTKGGPAPGAAGLDALRKR